MIISDLLNAAKQAANIPSDRKLATHLNISNAAVSKWRTGHDLPTIAHAHKLALMAGLDPAQVITEVLIQGSKSPALIQTLKRFKSVAIAGIITLIILQPIVFKDVSSYSVLKELFDNNIHYTQLAAFIKRLFRSELPTSPTVNQACT